MKRITALGMAFGFAAALAGTGPAAAQIKIGVAGPLTGGSAAFGAQLKNGVEQAVADINAARAASTARRSSCSSATIAATPRRASRSLTSSWQTA